MLACRWSLIRPRFSCGQPYNRPWLSQISVAGKWSMLWTRCKWFSMMVSAVWPCSSALPEDISHGWPPTMPCPVIVMSEHVKCLKLVDVMIHACQPCPFITDASLAHCKHVLLCWACSIKAAPWSVGIFMVPHIFLMDYGRSLHLYSWVETVLVFVCGNISRRRMICLCKCATSMERKSCVSTDCSMMRPVRVNSKVCDLGWWRHGLGMYVPFSSWVTIKPNLWWKNMCFCSEVV